MKTKPLPSPSPRLRLSAAQSRALRKFANLLEVRPEDFIKWQVGHLLKDLEEGFLEQWAAELLEYDEPGQAERVKARTAAWLKRRQQELQGMRDSHKPYRRGAAA